MCGIAGFADIGVQRDAPEVLTGMVAALRHRGPDGYGLYVDDRVGLANARLAVLDVANGWQPMVYDDAVLAFNGEIFNYLELAEDLRSNGVVPRTSSDTEILLHCLRLWDTAALSKLNGQFAFAFLDRRGGRLLLGRDRFGERPLFYAEPAGGLVFASEIKALFTLPMIERRLSGPALQRSAHLWTPLPDETVFAGIRALPPGHFLRWENGVSSLGRYYTLPLDMPRIDADPVEAIEETRRHLRRAMRWRLRSDVPLAVYVSGGLDSAITARLAAEESSCRLNSFSVTFDDAAYDEAGYQAQVVASLGTTHHAVHVSRRDIAEVFPSVVRHAETALFRTAPAPMFLLAREARKAGIKVVVTGEGADESFLGYDIFKETLLRAGISRGKPAQESLDFLKRFYRYMPHFNTESAQALLNFFTRHAGSPESPLYSHEVRLSNGIFSSKLFSGEYDEEGTLGLLETAACGHFPGFLVSGSMERCQAIEFITLLSGYLLSSQGDRMTAAHGLEGRYPFLDHEVVALAASLPKDFLLKAGLSEKHLLKEAYADALPAVVTERPKQPYRAPDAACFLGDDVPDWVADITTSRALRGCPVVNPDFAERLLSKLRAMPSDRISPREDQALVMLLSTLLLQTQFIDGGGDFPALLQDSPSIFIDKRA